MMKPDAHAIIERRRAMNAGGWKNEDEERIAQRVWKCGGLRSLFLGPKTVPAPPQSARRLAHSKTWRWVALFVSAFSFEVSSLAQSYAIDWHTIDGGGGTSTGGVYSVSGTLGQPDAGAMSGGTFTVVGGFWSVIAVQTPGAPYLTVFRTATNTVVVSWPLAGAEGWVLQATNALPSLPVPWPVIPPPYQTNGANLEYIEPSPVGNKFYRLAKP